MTFKRHNVVSATVTTPSPLLAGLLLVTIITCLILSQPIAAEQALHGSADNGPFYRQLIPSDINTLRPVQASLLNHVMANESLFKHAPSTPSEDDDLAFNYLWMQQYQQGYQYKDGGAAMGTLFRMGVKTLYKTYTGNATVNSADGENMSTTLSELDYQLKVSGNKVRLRVKYEF